MPDLSKYIGYTKYSNDVAAYRESKLKEEKLRQSVFANKKLSQEEFTLARKRGEVLKRNIDALDEYAHTLNEGVESVVPVRTLNSHVQVDEIPQSGGNEKTDDERIKNRLDQTLSTS